MWVIIQNCRKGLKRTKSSQATFTIHLPNSKASNSLVAYTAMLTINRHFAFLWYKMRSLWEGKTYAKNTTSPLNLCYILKRGFDLSILKIWGLLVKGLQSYQLSKLVVTRKSLPRSPGPSRTSWPGFELYRGQIILKVWQMVTLQPFNLQTSNF